jgi:hypothetical protein
MVTSVREVVVFASLSTAFAGEAEDAANLDSLYIHKLRDIRDGKCLPPIELAI